MQPLRLIQPLCEAAAASDQGKVRRGNEDAFGLSREDGIFLVCDGMGGAAGGEIASNMAVSAILNHFADRKRDLTSVSRNKDATRVSPGEILGDAIASASRTIFSRSLADAKLHGMGTTVVALAVAGSTAWVAHVGDSRCYRLRGGTLEQMTLDHSLVAEQVRMGSITPDEAARSPIRNVITRAVGCQKIILADTAEMELEEGDLFLLCSDGLTRELNCEKLQTILVGVVGLDAACIRLIDEANQCGGHDNITCVLVRIPGLG